MHHRLIATYRAAFADLPQAVWQLAFVTLIHRAGTMVLPFLVLYLTNQHGFDVGTAGYFLAIYGVGSVVGAVVGGRLSDRWGARRAMQLTLMAAGLGFWVLSAMAHPIAMAVTLGLTAMAVEGFRPSSSTALGDAAPAAVRTRAFALRRLAINLGMSIGPAVGGLLAMRDYRWLFGLDGATCLLAALAVTAWLHPPATTPTPRSTPALDPTASEARSPWHDQAFVMVLVATFVLHLAFNQFYSAYALTLNQDFRLSEAVIGALFAFNTVLVVLFEMVVVYRLRHHRPLAVVAVGCVWTTVGFVLLPLDPRVAFAFGVMAVLTLGEMLTSPLLEGFVAGRFAGARLGRAMGLFTASFLLAFVIAPVLGTAVYDAHGYRLLWHACAAIALVSSVLFVIANRLARAR